VADGPARRPRAHLFKLKYLMEEHFDEIATTVTREHGKTLDEARGSCAAASRTSSTRGGIPPDDGEDARGRRQRHRLRVRATAAWRVRGDHPFNFPAMVPCWFWPYAIATGTPSSSSRASRSVFVDRISS